MRHFVCEYVTAGGMQGQGLPASLQREGGLMLSVLAAELLSEPGTALLLTRDNRIPDLIRVPSRLVKACENVWAIWADYLRACDYFWPIAPESGNSLLRLTQLAETTACRILGSSSVAIAQCMSKYSLAQTLAEIGVTAIETRRLIDYLAGAHLASDSGWIVKPDIGAGCERCYYMDTAVQLQQFASQCPDKEQYIVQPYMPGQALSLSTLMYKGAAQVLACNRQRVTIRQGAMRLQGLEVNTCADRRIEFLPLAQRIAATFPALAGFVGIDILLHRGQVVLVEINPRITTAMAGLSASLGRPVSKMLLDLFDQGRFPRLPRQASAVVLNLSSH